ncbi:MAG: hypothetical protein JSW17_06615 [Candidatus Omnitrophota bacterium]|nr:MAG: hypothetical protein JSW17_06615 [Candidatus Omnitrophota bacterium]
MKASSVIFIILFTLVFIPFSVFAAASDDFLVELGESYLEQGFLEDAQIEFRKALIVNPDNEKAKAYLKEIRQRTLKKELGSLLEDIEEKAKLKARESRPKKELYPVKKVVEPMPAPMPEGAFPVASFDPSTGEIIEMMPEEEKIVTRGPFPVAAYDPSTGEIYEVEAVEQELAPAPFPIASFDPYSGEIVEVSAKPRKEKVSVILDEFAEKAGVFVPYKVKKGPLLREVPQATITGEYQASIGIEGDDIIWHRANWDLNEKNWRILSHAAFDRKINTFDPGIYNAIRFEVDTPQGEKASLHADIDISPWSFIGKSDKVTVMSTFADAAEVQLKYWANTGYTINEIFYSDLLGDAFALPEVKVSDWETDPVTAQGAFGVLDVWAIPGLEIEREYWPLREVWFDYNTEGISLRLFPVALQDQAYTSDDILRLSNNAMYWEESPWLSSWTPGNFNSFAGPPPDFSKGRFDDSLAFFTRNSRGEFLTNLRGMSLSLGSDHTSWDMVAASPKTLWQDYDSFDTFDGASRLKHKFADNFEVGGVYTAKAGYEKGERDATIQTAGVDMNLGFNYVTKVSMEAASSKSSIDRTTPYETEKRGNAWKFRLVHASEGDVFNTDYFGLKPKGDSTLPFYKLRLEYTHMDEAFETGLSSYIRTRDDSYWSRHIHFGEPLVYFGAGFYEPTIGWNDIEPFRLGDGVDFGRDVVGLRIEGNNFLDGKCDWLFDARNVYLVDGEYLETVSRLESTYRVNNRLTTKLLGIYHDKPDTVGGIDPYAIDVKTGKPLLNSVIPDGEDPSVRTFSAAAEYKLNDNFSVWGIWEHTNDYSLAYDNFPRGILNGSGFGTYYEDGNIYREEIAWLYGQDLFPLPPYDSYDISKAGMNLRLSDQLCVGIDWTCNEYKFAGPIDNNMNHSGFELEFSPSEKLSYFFKYVYSRWMDINQIIEGVPVEFADHHNFFGEVSYRPNPSDEFILQYGVYPRGVVGELLYDPYGGTLATLDTQHMVRLYYRKKF